MRERAALRQSMNRNRFLPLAVFLFLLGLAPAHAQQHCYAQFQFYSLPGRPDSVHFNPAQTTPTTQYMWSFGDRTYSHNPDPWHRYMYPGMYIACLTVTDSTAQGTCTATWCDTVVVGSVNPPTCDARFTHYAAPNNPDSVHFYPMQAQSSHTAQYRWSFGDGTFSHTVIPWHTYGHAGTYVVCLTVTDSSAAGTCTDTWCDTLTIGSNPLHCYAQFQFYALQGRPDSVHFVPAQNTPTTRYHWNFDDRTYSSGHDPWHVFAPGTYVVCLTVTDTVANPQGTCTATWCDTVVVAAVHVPTCDARFLHYASRTNPDSIQFLPMYVPNPHSGRYVWNFGDGSSSTSMTAWHRYAHPGTYVACLTVTDSTAAGVCSDTWCDTIVVAGAHAPLCDAHFQYYANPHNTDSLHFYPAQAQYSQSARYHWSFDDGQYSHNRDPWHLYAHEGIYVVCLTVTDTTAGGVCSDTWCDTVYVAAPQPPVCDAHFQHYVNPHNPDSLHFYPIQSQTRVNAHYSWSFGDGQYSQNRDPWHLYAQQGTYVVCLTVTDTTAGGTCSDTWCDTVYVATPQPPVCDAQFTHYSAPNYPDSVHFYPTAAQHSRTAQYLWSFGDGGTSHSPSPWHTYAHSGTYIVCLTVTDSTAYGVCTDTWCAPGMVIPFVQIYPNPAINRVSVTVAGSEHPLTLQIHDEKGRLLHSEQTGNGTRSVSTDGLSSGTYFYRLMDGENVVATGKFMVVQAQ